VVSNRKGSARARKRKPCTCISTTPTSTAACPTAQRQRSGTSVSARTKSPAARMASTKDALELMKPHPKLSPYANGRVSTAGQRGRPSERRRNAVASGSPRTIALRKSRFASSRGTSHESRLTR
jgi:hypothetical protein